MKKRLSPCLYRKIILFISMISIIPVIVIGLFSFFRSSKAIENYVSKEKEHTVYQIQTNVEQVLKTVDHSLTQMTTSYLMIESLREPMTANQFQLYNQLRKELSHLQTFDTKLADVVLVSFPNAWLINNYGLQRLTEQQIEKLKNNYLTLKTPSVWILDERQEHIYKETAMSRSSAKSLLLVKKVPLIGSKHTGVIFANIPVSGFTNLFYESSDIGNLFVLDNNGNIIIKSRSEEDLDITENPDVLTALKQPDNLKGQFRTNIGGTSYHLIFRKSDYNNWTYISLVKLRELRKQTMSIGWLTLSITAILVIISGLIALAGSKHLYRPVKRLQTILFNSLTINEKEQNQDEFAFIESHVKDVIKQNDNLEKTLQSQMSQLKQFFISRLLDGKVNQEEGRSKFNYFGYNQNYKRIAVLSLQIDEFNGYKRKEEDVLLLVINQLVEKMIAEKERMTPIVKNHNQVTIILTNQETKEGYIYHMNQIASLIQQRIKEEYDLSVSIGISEPFKNILEAKQAYKESLEALKYTLKYGTGSIIFFENLERKTGLHTYYPKNIENDLFDAIKIYDGDQVDMLLDQLIDEIFKENSSHTQYQISIVRFLNDLIELMQTLAIDVLELSDSRQVFEKIFDLKSKKEIKEWFRFVIIKPLMKQLEQRSESKYKTISENIVHIIQSEYDTDLTLDTIAARLHYNPNYLSSIFRKEMNISFSEYLSMYRIHMAKKWLVETDMSIKDISNKLNYNNPQNFIRSFKKVEGITPGKYREKNRGY